MLHRIKQIWKKSWLLREIERRDNEKYIRRLRNDNFSILCSNCIGGIIYHKLGKQFLSPTINMFMSNKSFIDFSIHLDIYMNQELVFLQTERPYPVALLPGNPEQEVPQIYLFFNHTESSEQAKLDWNRRKSRLNWDNLFFILYNLDGLTPYDIMRMETVSCKNKVILTAEPLPDVPWSCTIKSRIGHHEGDTCLDRDILGRATFEKNFDFVSWLNVE